MQATLTIDLLRHGQLATPEGFYGSTDAPLSAQGLEQMRAACGNERGWDALFSSPMNRCRTFADPMAASLGVAASVDERLTATRFGQWETLTPETLARTDAELYARFRGDPFRCRPRGGESALDVAQRTHAFMQRVLEAPPGRHLLIVTHSNVILSMIALTLAMPVTHWGSLPVGYGSFTRLRFARLGAGWSGQVLRHVSESPTLGKH